MMDKILRFITSKKDILARIGKRYKPSLIRRIQWQKIVAFNEKNYRGNRILCRLSLLYHSKIYARYGA